MNTLDPRARVPWTTAGTRRLALLALILLAGPGLSDDVSDALDQARIKLRAGKTEEGLKILDGLRAEHPGDPRIEYERYQLLESLDRRNEALDALEDAESALVDYRKSGGKSAAVLAVEKKIASVADDALLYRREVRKALGDYREKAATLGRKIAGDGSPAHLVYVLCELERAQVSTSLEDDSLLGDLVKKVGAEALAARAEAQAELRRERPEPEKAQQALLKKNIAAAQRAVQGRKLEEARLSALAALEIAPLDLTALVVLGEALAGLSRDEEAAEAAVRALDAPKAGVSTAVSLCRRALAVVKKVAPDLATFQALRDETTDEVLRILKRAQQKKRAHDVDWIAGVARRIDPADPQVEALGEIVADPAAGGPRRSASGFVSLLDRSVRWDWKDKGPGSGLVGKDLVFTNNRSEFMCMATPPEITLARKFTLRFQLRYDFAPDQRPPVFFLFEGDPAIDDDERAFIFIPEGPHHVGLGRQPPGESWKISEVQALPEGIPANRQWFAYEIAWDDSSKRLTLKVGTRVVFDYTLRPSDTLHGSLGFGFGEGNEMRIREVYLRNER